MKDQFEIASKAREFDIRHLQLFLSKTCQYMRSSTFYC